MTAPGTNPRCVVELVMGFCTPEQHLGLQREQAPIFEKMLTDDGIILVQVLVFSQPGRAVPPIQVARIRYPQTVETGARSIRKVLKRWDEFTDAKTNVRTKPIATGHPGRLSARREEAGPPELHAICS